MTRFSIFQRAVLLPSTPAEVYSFHEDPRNITKISPASLRVERVECGVPAKEGDEFRLRVRQFGLPLEWVGFWEKAEPDSVLIDGARKAPFTHWRHHHLFERAGRNGEQTLMTDRVEYALRLPTPFGFLGHTLDGTLMRLIFTLMFMARHRATKAYFKKAQANRLNNEG